MLSSSEQPPPHPLIPLQAGDFNFMEVHSMSASFLPVVNLTCSNQSHSEPEAQTLRHQAYSWGLIKAFLDPASQVWVEVQDFFFLSFFWMGEQYYL